MKLARLEWIAGQSQLAPSQRVFIDETGASTELRGYMGAPCVERAAGPRFHMDIGRAEPWLVARRPDDPADPQVGHEWRSPPGLCRTDPSV